jgi:hypothetical protein
MAVFLESAASSADLADRGQASDFSVEFGVDALKTLAKSVDVEGVGHCV